MQRNRLIGTLAVLASMLIALVGVACAYLGVRMALAGFAGKGGTIFVGAVVMLVMFLFAGGVSWLAWRWGIHRMRGLREDTLELNRGSVVRPKPR